MIPRHRLARVEAFISSTSKTSLIASPVRKSPLRFISHGPPSQISAPSISRASTNTFCRTSATRSFMSPSLQEHVTNTKKALESLSPVLNTLFPLDNPVRLTGSVLGILSLLAILKYREAIRRQLELLQRESWIFGMGVRMERTEDDAVRSNGRSITDGVFQNLKMLELNPEFGEKHAKDWQLVTLGDYLSSLRPKGLPKQLSVDDMPLILQREIEAGLAVGLLKALGPSLGRALLPAVGTGFVQQKAQALATNVASKWFLSPSNSEDDKKISSQGIGTTNDKGGIPVSLMTLLAIADTNSRLNGGLNDELKLPLMETSAIGKMMIGEVVKGPSFCESGTSIIPDNFIVSEHFDLAIQKMERRLGSTLDIGGQENTAMKIAMEEALEKESDMKEALFAKTDKEEEKSKSSKLPKECYNPDDRRMGESVPVNPRLFPDLHLGYGDALLTHTKREVLKMRLISILLNKLGANYYKQVEEKVDASELFSIQMTQDDKPITTPWEFVKALIDSGHQVEVVPSSRLTTFGVGMCIKEKDGSWTNVPLSIFLESGYEDANGNMAPAMLPHSGLDMYISGPLAGHRGDGTPSKLALQHFIGIEGFCGWHANANADVPFNEAVTVSERLSGSDAVRAARIAGLYANVLNGLATDLALPFGGYGLTAVCNDSAAIIQYILYGKTTIYPMTSIGRFMSRTMRYSDRFRQEMMESNGSADLMKEEIDDLQAINQAMRKLPSDINASPSNAKSAAERMLLTLQPKLPFVLMTDAKRIMESILEEETVAERCPATERFVDQRKK